MPSQSPAESNAWKNGVDEWGRVWKNGMYLSGVVETAADLERFRPPISYAERFSTLSGWKPSVPASRALPVFGTHIGPFMNAYMAMGWIVFACGSVRMRLHPRPDGSPPNGAWPFSGRRCHWARRSS